MPDLEPHQTFFAESKPPTASESNTSLGVLTHRGLFEYLDKLNLTEKELNDPNTLLLDLGSGTKQDFAREMKFLDLKSQVISVDPRLALPLEKDLAIPGTDRQARREGRLNPVENSIAALGEALPFRSNSFEKIYAMYSVPFYLEQKADILATLKEIHRVLKPGGEFKGFPIIKDQKEILEPLLAELNDIHASFELKYSDDEGDEEWLLTFKKIDHPRNSASFFDHLPPAQQRALLNLKNKLKAEKQ